MTPNEKAFIERCAAMVATAQVIRQNPAAFLNFSSHAELFGERAEGYAASFANPARLAELGFPVPGLLSEVYLLLSDAQRNALLGRPIYVWEKTRIVRELEHCFSDPEAGRVRLQRVLNETYLNRAAECSYSLELEKTDVENVFSRILDRGSADSLEWMTGYAQPVTETDRRMAAFWFSQELQLLNELAEHIVEAFFHGFLSQSREIAGRKRVQLRYTIGQEALAQRVRELFRQRGLAVIVLEPFAASFNSQFLADHAWSEAVCTDPGCCEHQQRAYAGALDQLAEELRDICGMVKIGQFGAEPAPAEPAAFVPEDELKTAYTRLEKEKRELEARLLKPDTLSFCSIVFPDMRVGKDFRSIFRDFCTLNLEESEPAELIQQTIIAVLDTCSQVVITGRDDNRTNLQVQLAPLADPDTQTNFLNCGGDLNVPHGELFTTPVLQGTNGLLHVQQLYLNGLPFTDLLLEFSNGRVKEGTCSLFTDEQQNRRYVAEQLLHGASGVTMGEWSIGTNTFAYAIAEAYDLLSRLPILLVEKMGPHLAVGDPCFARGEKRPVYDLYTGKEMSARWNEVTADTETEAHECYFGFHTDITIPFKQIGSIRGLRADGSAISILEEGRFVLAGTEALNAPLDTLYAQQKREKRQEKRDHPPLKEKESQA